MRLTLFIILSSTFFGCGDGDTPTFEPSTFEPRAESEIGDCEISGIGEEKDGTIAISSIAELEALHKHPCGNYRGSLRVSDIDGIENLKGLQNLRKVAGLDVSFLGDVRTLDGIEALEITGTRSLLISDNPKLTSIAALNAPQALALTPNDYRQDIWLSISDNPKIESLKGLENLRDLEKARVQIIFNASLKNLEGLNNIQTLEFAEIHGNYSLKSMNGLDSLESGGALVIESHPLLQNINDAMPNLKSLEYLTVERNDKVSPCEVEAIAARVDIGEVFESNNGGTQPCD